MNAEQNQLVTDLARDLVAQMAPQELPLFRANSANYFKNPDKALQPQTGKDDMLGFGAGEVVTLLTPYLLAVLTEVVTFIVEEVKKSAKTQGTNVINDMVKQMFKKFQPQPTTQEQKPAPSAPPLTHDQLAQIRQLAFEKSRKLKLSGRQSAMLADSIVGSLVLAPA